MKCNSLEELFLCELRDLYDAEQQLVKALPKMAKAASSNPLRQALEDHLEETKHQVDRLETIFGQFDQKAKAETCDAMKGLIAEGKKMIDLKGESAPRDAGLIAAAQKVEHYEIAAYGTLVSWAEQLGRPDAAQLLRQTLNEEKSADEKLTALAESAINMQATTAAM